jgi:hypothetical protein
MGKVLFFFFTCFLLFQGDALAQLRLTALSDSAKAGFSLPVLPQNFYNQHLSFFCKKEAQLQKLTSLPLIIRVGSKDEVDYLEKKPHAVWRPK